MDLWVRSQAKNVLNKVENLYIEKRDYIQGEFWDIVDKTFVYGHYKTKERALEVLDEIQNYIIGKLLHNDGNVYEMPKE